MTSVSRNPALMMTLTRMTIWISFVWIVSFETASSKSLVDTFRRLDEKPGPDDLDYYLAPMDDASLSSRPVWKRSPRATSEIRLSDYLQKLRSRKSHDHHQSLDREGSSSADNGNPTGLDTKAIDLYGALMFLEGYQAAKTGPEILPGDDSIEKSIDELQRNGYGDIWRMNSGGVTSEHEDLTKSAMQKRKLGNIRSPGEIHPVYLGRGQQAANSALSTFASLVAEEEKRLQNSEDLPSSPVRFIGKRSV